MHHSPPAAERNGGRPPASLPLSTQSRPRSRPSSGCSSLLISHNKVRVGNWFGRWALLKWRMAVSARWAVSAGKRGLLRHDLHGVLLLLLLLVYAMLCFFLLAFIIFFFSRIGDVPAKIALGSHKQSSRRPFEVGPAHERERAPQRRRRVDGQDARSDWQDVARYLS